MKYVRAALVAIILIVSMIIFETFLHRHHSINDQIASKLRAYNNHFQEVLYTQFFDDKILSFYRVNSAELAFGVFEDRASGLKLISGSGNAALVSEDALTWTAIGSPKGAFSLIYGSVLNPQITQVVVLSEASKAATIVESKGIKLWFLKLDAHPKSPVTIRAMNREGAVVYENGDPDFWGVS